MGSFPRCRRNPAVARLCLKSGWEKVGRTSSPLIEVGIERPEGCLTIRRNIESEVFRRTTSAVFQLEVTDTPNLVL